MKLSRLEPHVVQPDDTDDIHSFLDEIRALQNRTKEVSSEVSLRQEGVGSSDDEVKQGFVRLVDFLKSSDNKKKKRSGKTKVEVALRAYLIQRELPSLLDDSAPSQLKKAI